MPPPDVVVTDVAAVKQNFARLNVVKSLDEQYDGALAAATGPNKSHTVLRLDDEIEVVQNEGIGPRGIGEANVAELDAALQRRDAVAAGNETLV